MPHQRKCVIAAVKPQINGGTRFREIQSPLTESMMGRFVMRAQREQLTLYGVLWVPKTSMADPDPDFIDLIKHKDVIATLREIGKEIPKRGNGNGKITNIGGGFIQFDMEERVITAGGRSGSFGYVPRHFVEDALAADFSPEFTIRVVGSEIAEPESNKARRWYHNHRVPISDHPPLPDKG